MYYMQNISQKVLIKRQKGSFDHNRKGHQTFQYKRAEKIIVAEKRFIGTHNT